MRLPERSVSGHTVETRRVAAGQDAGCLRGLAPGLATPAKPLNALTAAIRAVSATARLA